MKPKTSLYCWTDHVKDCILDQFTSSECESLIHHRKQKISPDATNYQDPASMKILDTSEIPPMYEPEWAVYKNDPI